MDSMQSDKSVAPQWLMSSLWLHVVFMILDMTRTDGHPTSIYYMPVLSKRFVEVLWPVKVESSASLHGLRCSMKRLEQRQV